MKIAVTSVSVYDPVVAFMFYTQKLGFRERLFEPEHGLAIVVSPEDEDGTALLLEPRGGQGSDAYFDGLYNSGLPAIVFSTDDIDAEFERLKDAGIVFRQPPTNTGRGTQALFEDTCGNLIQLFQA